MNYRRLGRTGLSVSEIGCGGCEERCPFGVKVTERMEQAKKLFE